MDRNAIPAVVSMLLVMFGGGVVRAAFELGAEQLVEAGGVRIDVPGYSVPSFVDFNSDGLNDLVVGEGYGSGVGKVRVYLNQGTAVAPSFTSYFFVQANGADIKVAASGCMGIFPRVVDWDGDGRKDLLAGLANGMVQVYLNTATDANPVFDGGHSVQAGAPGMELPIDVGNRATPSVVDYNNDGRKDLVSGAYDGRVWVYLNGADGGMAFESPIFVKAGGSQQIVDSRSSPVVMDMNGDGKKDLLCGDTEGRLAFFANVGTDEAPVFGGAELLKSDGVVINLAGSARSRPFVTDWTGDGYLDILVGAGDGNVHLFQGVPEPATIVLLGLGAAMMLKK